MPLGQAAGTGINPRFCAPLQASFDGAGPPLHVCKQLPPAAQAMQLILATHPPALTIISEVKTKVRQPDVPRKAPGVVVPVKVPNKGDAVFGPL